MFNLNISSPRVNKHVILYYTRKPRGFRTITYATAGVIPPDTIEEPFEVVPPEPRVVALAGKLEAFPGKLATVPAPGTSGRDVVIESNAKAVWGYAKEQAKKKLVKIEPGFTGDVDLLFDETKYLFGATTSQIFETALRNCRKVFARGAWRFFWDAVGMKVQTGTELSQRINDNLGITPKEYDAIKDNLVYINRGFGYSARTTQSKEYILNVPPGTKKKDAGEFQDWYRKKAHTLVKIIRMNVSDIPFGYAPAEIQAFEANPKDPTAVKAIKGKLEQLQLEAIRAYRASTTTWDFEAWLEAK